MRYRLSLGNREIKSVISVSETVRNDIEEYHSLNGDSFCEPTAKPLRSWTVEFLADGQGRADGDELIDRFREMREDQKAERLTVSSEVGGFSARVLLKEMDIKAGHGGCSVVTLRLLEYQRATAQVTDSVRAGSIGDPPENIKAGIAYDLIVQYEKAGVPMMVANPSTGAEVSNLAALPADMILKAERCVSSLNSTLAKLEAKKSKVIGAAIGRIKT